MPSCFIRYYFNIAILNTYVTYLKGIIFLKFFAFNIILVSLDYKVINSCLFLDNIIN
jgi:hypothetical protein